MKSLTTLSARACSRSSLSSSLPLTSRHLRSRNSLFIGVGLQCQPASRHGYADFVNPDISDDKREKVVILGSGWAGYVLSRKLDPKLYRVLVVSPRSYFVFTPLLAGAAVGTLEFRNVVESVRKKNSQVQFLQGWADDVNFADKTVTVEPSVLDPDVGHALTGPRKPNEQQTTQGFVQPGLTMGGTGGERVPTFPVRYDKLFIAVGSYSQTFNTKGVRENALFLKDVGDARKIRRRVLELFELAQLPFVPEEVKQCLLHFVVVGGGPTGIEFAAELADLLHDDLSKLHPGLMKYVKITLYDVAPKILPMFDASLADYAVKRCERQNITIKTSHHVEELRKGFPNDPKAAANQNTQVKGRVYTIRTKEEGDIGIGMCVWSTGNMNNPFVQKALDHIRRFPTASAHITEGELADPNAKQWIIQRDVRTGSLLVDDHFRLQLQTGQVDQSSAKNSSAKLASSNSSSSSSESSTDATATSSSPRSSKAIMTDVFALGDTTKLPAPLPATAQVANQQALWLAKALNKNPYPTIATTPSPSQSSSIFASAADQITTLPAPPISMPSPSPDTPFSRQKGFSYKNMGVMTYLGGAKAVLQGPPRSREKNSVGGGIKGWIAFLIWRGAYLTFTLSWRNKLLVPIMWVVVWVFGRDVSRF